MSDEPPPLSAIDAAFEPVAGVPENSVSQDLAATKAQIKGLQNMIRHNKSIERLASLRRDLAACRARLTGKSGI